MKKERKKLPLTPALERHLELVERYYEVDRENRVIFLRLRYEKASDILDLDIGDKNRPSFKTEIIARVVDIIGTFPDGFKVNIQFQINDYEGYDPQLLIESFNDEFEFNHFCSNKDSRTRWLRAALLVMCSVIIIFTKTILSTKGMLGEGILNEAYSLILETVATLFVWEAATILFLTLSDHRVIGAKILAKVSTLAYLDKDGNKIIEEDKMRIIHNWVDTGKLFRVGSVLLIFFSSATLVTGVSRAIASGYSYASVIDSLPQEILQWTSLTINLAIAIITFLSGLGYYADKGRLRKFASVFAWVSIAAVALELTAYIVMAITGQDITFGMIARSSIGLIAGIGFATGYFIVRKARSMRDVTPHK